MRSAKSCFNPTLFRKNLTRFWPIWALYGIIWLFVLPVQILIDPDYVTTQRWPLLFLDNGGLGLGMAVIFGLLSAMAVFSYLYNNRSVGLMHALPVRREGLFLTSYLSGLAFLVGPNLIVFLLSLFAELGTGTLAFSSLFTWLVVESLLCFFFYSFAVFCGMLTGHILAQPAFYIIFNGLAAGVALLLQSVAEQFLFGFTGFTGLEVAATWLTPVLRLLGSMSVYYDYESPVARPLTVYPESVARFSGLSVVFFYAFIGLVLTVLALLLYRRRQLETAGDVVSVRWVRPIFKYSVGACSAMALGTLLYVIFSSVVPESAWVLLLFMLIGGFVGYFIAEMLLCKSARVFRRGWKGCLVLLACVVVSMCALELDLGGFERRVPDADKVESVVLTGVSSAPYDSLNFPSCRIEDPEQIAALLALHQSIVDNKDDIEDLLWYNSYTVTDDGLSLQDGASTSVSISYLLSSGKTLRRSYPSIPITPELLEDPASPAALLNSLINDPALVEAAYFSSQLLEEGARLLDAMIGSVYFPADDCYGEVYVDSSFHDALMEAVHADIQAGDLGRRYLLDNQDRLENCCQADLVLTYSLPNTLNVGEESSTLMVSSSISIGLEISASRTMEVLRAATNDFDGGLLLTHAESQRMENISK